jgi:hypothetical protein
MQSEKLPAGVVTSSPTRPPSIDLPRRPARAPARTCGRWPPGRHEQAWQRPIVAATHWPPWRDDLAVLDVVDVLAEVPHVAVRALCVVVARALDQFPVLELLHLYDGDRHTAMRSEPRGRGTRRGREPPRRTSRSFSLQHGQADRRERDERVIDLRRVLRGIEGAVGLVAATRRRAAGRRAGAPRPHETS